MKKLQHLKGKALLSVVLLCLLFTKAIVAQVPNANSFSSYLTYTGNYSYGMNPGYYGNNWTSQNIATLAMGSTAANVKGVGVKSLRVPLYDSHLSTYGLNAEMPKFQHYASLGGSEFTAFVGSPSAANREPTTFPGSPEQAKTFKGLYEPVWLDAAQTQINPANTYAKYLYDVVNMYGQYVKFWEIVNEPDFTYSNAGWLGDQNPPGAGSWFDHNPTPAELENLRAPVFYYIRMLRVSWEVIKKLQPNDFVCTGGLGYSGFLDALLRNSDNPADGSVNTQYPLKGGAYFDILSFHIYPQYNLKTWSNNNGGGFIYNRHSDGATGAYIKFKDNMETILTKYGYNGSQYPKKQYICTETGLSRIMTGDNWGSNEGQRNYIVKAQIASQRSNIKQLYWFQLGDQANAYEQFDQMGCYRYFGSSTPYYATATDQGIALKTTSDLLYGKAYDANKTAALSLPSNVDGGAFRGTDGTYVYVLWAKTNIDLSETANATYSFPSTAVMSANVTRKEWNFSQTNSSTSVAKTNIALTGSPSFFTDGTGTGNQAPVVTAGNDQTITLPVNAIQVTGSATDADGTVTGYSWSQVSGPWPASIVSPNQAATRIENLIQGTYEFALKATDNAGATAIGNVKIVVNPLSTTPPSTGTTTRIEAENYTSMSGVQTETTYDAGGGKNVGWIDQGDWMEYSYSAPSAGTYTLNLRVAALNSGGQLQIKNAAGNVLATVPVPATGGYQNFQTISTTLTLPAGSQTLRVVSSAPTIWNFNWLELTGGSSTTIPVPSEPSTSLKIEAENYTSMSGVQTEVCYDAGGGKNVGWIEQGDWMEYSVTVPTAGSYTLNLRVATPNTGAQAQIKSASGTVLSTVTLPNTGAYQTWQTTSTTLNLQAGTQTIRLQSSTQPGWNINWLELIGGSNTSTGTPPPSTATSLKIEAENYSTMSGVQTEVTYDAGGGKNVGWIDQGDWMEYSVTVPSAGSYTLNLRVATPNTGAQVQVKNAAGNVLTTATLPNTGAYQTWQTTSTTINLAAGTQTIRLQSSASPGWNINWLEVVSAGTVSATLQSQSTTTATSVAPALEVFPNPVSDKFVLQLSNELTGSVDVQIVSLQGSVVKQLTLTKTATGTSQFYVSIGELPTGSYLLKATMNSWSESKQISKL